MIFQMAEEQQEKKRNFFQKLHDKYRLIIYNDDTFEEVWFFRLSRLNVIAVLGTSAIILIALVSLLIAFTPLKEFIPGYPQGDIRMEIISNNQKLDSLEQELKLREQYLDNLSRIMSGKTPVEKTTSQDSTIKTRNIEFKKSKHDSILREQIEKEEKYTLSFNYKKSKEKDLSRIHFFTPVKGIVTNPFNQKNDHLGTDIVADKDMVVVSTLEGTVTMANWTLKTGYVIQIQHANNILSVYKHNAELLKDVGDHVKAGEAIAIIGNSGELSSGPHLHFELWKDGSPLDPENYIVF
jgi:murein DD-endopeptidase MepM/ murein hydrolase activator NlpD